MIQGKLDKHKTITSDAQTSNDLKSRWPLRVYKILQTRILLSSIIHRGRKSEHSPGKFPVWINKTNPRRKLAIPTNQLIQSKAKPLYSTWRSSQLFLKWWMSLHTRWCCWHREVAVYIWTLQCAHLTIEVSKKSTNEFAQQFIRLLIT